MNILSIYLDHCATTPILDDVLKTYQVVSQKYYGNPSSIHTQGEQAHILLEKARQQLAELFHISPQELYFTSGGTESNNWVIKGTALEKRTFGNHMIISSIEHASVKKTVEQLKQLGWEIDYIPVDKQGFIQMDQLSALIRSETVLVSVIAVNNEVGSIQPILELGNLLQNFPQIHLHVDAVQALGKIPMKQWFHPRVDFFTGSAHKVHGPKGSGLLYWKHGKKLAPLITGGGQEFGYRSGTEHVAGHVAAAKAYRMTMEQQEDSTKKVAQLKTQCMEHLKQYPNISIFSPEHFNYSPYILCFGIQGIKGEVIVRAFNQKNIALSTTSACSSKKKKHMNTLSAMGYIEKEAETAVRLSMSMMTTEYDIHQFLKTLDQVIQELNIKK